MADALKQKLFPVKGGDRLSCYHLEGGEPTVVLAGGYGQFGPLSKPFGQRVLAYCQARKLALYIIEFRGQGSSEGRRSSVSLPEMRDDLLEFAEIFSIKYAIGIGASLGAWALLDAYQHKSDLLWGMIALAPAVDWDLTYLHPRLAEGKATREGKGAILVREDGIVLTEKFLSSAGQSRLNLSDGLTFKGAIRILHGTEDNIAPLQRSLKLAEELAQAGNDTTIRIFPRVDHDVALLNTAEVQRGFIQECDVLLDAFRRHRSDQA